MNRNPIITCAVTGSGDTASKHPDLPKSPAEIATAAIEAAKAGAAIAHIHVREPETGKPSRDVELYREVVDRVASTYRFNRFHGAGPSVADHVVRGVGRRRAEHRS